MENIDFRLLFWLPRLAMTGISPGFHFIHDWAQIPVSTDFAHHGITALSDGSILTAHAEGGTLVVLGEDGAIRREFRAPVANAHSLERVGAGAETRVWITDNVERQVVCIDLDGQIIHRLQSQDMPAAIAASFCPTGTSVDPIDGGLWIADGYGSSTVNYFDTSLQHRLTLDGTEGAGRFDTPHSVHVDTRSEQARVFIADRANDRVQVFSRDGTFLETLDIPFRKPSAFAPLGSYLVIAELAARLVLSDSRDQVVAYFGDGTHHLQREGWPNRLAQNGSKESPRALIAEGEFNSPHGLCTDDAGNIYVTEWLIGDRFTKLARI